MSKHSTGEYASRSGARYGRVEYSRTESEPPSLAVAKALARFTDDDVIDTDTKLYDFVDPDALDALFADTYNGAPRQTGTIRFTVHDAQVVVRADSVEVYDCKREN